jgi:hypothetical protein
VKTATDIRAARVRVISYRLECTHCGGDVVADEGDGEVRKIFTKIFFPLADELPCEACGKMVEVPTVRINNLW